jgi:hypothetical protein
MPIISVARSIRTEADGAYSRCLVGVKALLITVASRFLLHVNWWKGGG